uniref:calmodulin-like protein 4 isoform X2 n=1 Tax=Myxine glutinosa TaxID=7769 RepID=UPI00358ECF59
MANQLTQGQINDYKDCFALYDRDRRGRLKAEDLLVSMRCLGLCPTPAEAEKHLRANNVGGSLDLSTFLAVMAAQQQQEDPEREILAAFGRLDPHGRGFVSATELRARLTRVGEKMQVHEVNDLLKEMNIAPNGLVKYEAFVKDLLLPPPDYH